MPPSALVFCFQKKYLLLRIRLIIVNHGVGQSRSPTKKECNLKKKIESNEGKQNNRKLWQI